MVSGLIVMRYQDHPMPEGKRGKNYHNQGLLTIWKYWLTSAVALGRGMQIMHD